MKRLIQQEGLPAAQFLENAAQKVERSLPKTSSGHRFIFLQALDQILTRVKCFTNADVCLNPGQQAATQELLEQTAAEAHLGDVLVAKAAPIATLINSFRLECRDCLNKTCPQRSED